MYPTDTHDEAELDGLREHRIRRRLVAVLIALLVILLLTFIPPLINVSRFQRQIDRNVSASLGRPVHFDQVRLNLLPLPGFTLENFVVEEDPAFGYEPILRAGEVRATIRLSSIWRRHVEFSKISLSAGDREIAPSVNLVHNADGRWNIQGLLFQASQINVAPTAQPYAGPAPRFPYIEATGARLNLKLDQEKTPFSLTDADFALWLPEPHQWHLRLKAQPVRTDTSPGDTGTLRVEGTLGGPNARADTLAQVPIDLHGDWQDAQLGGLSRLVLGRDAGVRGGFSLTLSMLGTVGQNAMTARIGLVQARRADFVPAHPLSLQAACHAKAADTFHSFSSIECRWPPSNSDAGILVVSGDVPDIRRPELASANVTVPGLPAATLLDLLGVAAPRAPTAFAGLGVLAGTLTWHEKDADAAAAKIVGRRAHASEELAARPAWSGEFDLSGESLQVPALGAKRIPLSDILLRSTPVPEAASAHSRGAQFAPATMGTPASSFDLLPVALPLGGKQPAIIEAHFDAAGYTVHLTGTVIPGRLLALGAAFPQFGDGLADYLRDASDLAVNEPAKTPVGETKVPVSASDASPENAPAEDEATAPIHLDLTAARTWGGAQFWHDTTPPPVHRRHR